MGALQVDDRGVIIPCTSCGQRNRVVYGRLDAETRCGQCRTPIPPPGEAVEVHDAPTFDAIVASAAVPIIVDFWAPWCGPCRMVAPEMAKVAARHAGHYLVLKINTDEVSELTERFGIRSIPMLAVFKGGREAGRTVGARPAAEIEAFVAGL